MICILWISLSRHLERFPQFYKALVPGRQKQTQSDKHEFHIRLKVRRADGNVKLERNLKQKKKQKTCKQFLWKPLKMALHIVVIQSHSIRHTWRWIRNLWTTSKPSLSSIPLHPFSLPQSKLIRSFKPSCFCFTVTVTTSLSITHNMVARLCENLT